MNRKVLVRLLEKNGWILKRHGGDHDIYFKGSKTESLPRHNKIDDFLAKSIIKRCGLK